MRNYSLFHVHVFFFVLLFWQQKQLGSIACWKTLHDMQQTVLHATFIRNSQHIWRVKVSDIVTKTDWNIQRWQTSTTTFPCPVTNTNDLTELSWRRHKTRHSAVTLNGVQLGTGHGSPLRGPVAASRLDVALKRVCLPLFSAGAVNTWDPAAALGPDWAGVGTPLIFACALPGVF